MNDATFFYDENEIEDGNVSDRPDNGFMVLYSKHCCNSQQGNVVVIFYPVGRWAFCVPAWMAIHWE